MIKVQQNAHRALKIEGGKNTMRKFLATLLALVMTLALMVPASWGENKETYQLPDSLEGKTVILHTNDVHGAIDKYAKVAALRDECYDKGAHQVILLDAGDYSQGSPYVSLSKGATALDMMALVGYDVITLGNHEFDYGFPQLMENLKKHQGDFMVACNNLVDDEGELLFAPGGTAPIYADDSYETELFRIAIVGMATPETQTKANPALMKGLSFIGGKDLYKVTQEDVDMARSEGNADIVIALGHLGVDKSSEPNCSYNVMQNVKGIDLFIDGHSHTVMTASKDNNMVQSTGTGLAYVGAIVIDNATKSIESNGLIDLSAYTKEDATVKAAADKIISDINAEYGKVFARTDVELNGAKDPGNRTQETNLGDLITDSMLWAIRKDAELTVPAENVVAITNGGGIRAWIHKGDISKLDVNTVLPFGNTVAVVYVTGAELLEALEASTFALPDSLGGFPQIAGMNISIDATKKYDPQTTPYPSGSGKATYYGPASINRVTINSVNGKAFDPNKTYAVVTNNFCAAGGDTYYAFAAASSQFDTGLPLDEVLMDYITTELKGVIGEQYKAPQGRVSYTEPFTDVTAGVYHDAIMWAYKSKITTGVTETTFVPKDSCTRAQIVTFLYRAAGSPEVAENVTNPFTDVSKDSVYYNAIMWAVEKKITTGVTDTTFEPNSPCTRAQIVTFLYREAGSPELAKDAANPFSDVSDSSVYYNAILWAVEKKITTGVTETTFVPNDTCTRAQAVTFLFRAK